MTRKKTMNMKIMTSRITNMRGKIKNELGRKQSGLRGRQLNKLQETSRTNWMLWWGPKRMVENPGERELRWMERATRLLRKKILQLHDDRNEEQVHRKGRKNGNQTGRRNESNREKWIRGLLHLLVYPHLQHFTSQLKHRYLVRTLGLRSQSPSLRTPPAERCLRYSPQNEPANETCLFLYPSPTNARRVYQTHTPSIYLDLRLPLREAQSSPQWVDGKNCTNQERSSIHTRAPGARIIRYQSTNNESFLTQLQILRLVYLLRIQNTLLVNPGNLRCTRSERVRQALGARTRCRLDRERHLARLDIKDRQATKFQ
jgi:hypothetical protein